MTPFEVLLWLQENAVSIEFHRDVVRGSWVNLEYNTPNGCTAVDVGETLHQVTILAEKICSRVK